MIFPSNLLHLAARLVRWWWRYGITLTISSVFLVVFLQRSVVLISDIHQAIAFDVSAYDFNYFAWEASAVRAKAMQVLFGQHAYFDETTRSNVVREYMSDLGKVQQLESQIEAIYSDSTVQNPYDQTIEQRQERDTLRDNLKKRQSFVEATIEGQVAAVLVDEGFGILGQLMPPIAMRFSRVPNLLIIAPRDEIKIEMSVAIEPLPVDEQTNLESMLDAKYDISSLIVPLGGIAVYPAIVIETTSIPHVVETFAHEWLHHYLTWYPLGLTYFTGEQGESRRINETTADLFGKEIARIVLQRYYPEQPLPQLPAYNHKEQDNPSQAGFDFTHAMHETRVRVDELLAGGDINTAEAYMESQRQLFVDHGYRIRKINQAFFAFYGGYQAGGGIAGSGGNDPIGPALIALRADSPSIYEFVRTVRVITNTNQLVSAVDQNGD